MSTSAFWVAIYLVVQFGIGIWVSRRIRTEDDYLVAGRKLGYTVATFSLFATWFGAETVIASAGSVASDGLSFTSAEPFGYGLCLILVGLLLAGPIWRRKLTTLADLFRERFGADVEKLAALVMIPTSLLWAAAQVRAFGYVLSTVTTLDPNVATLVAAGVAVLYTAVGGLLVDAITDLIQGVVLTVGLLALLFAAVGDLGGWRESISAFIESDSLRLGAADSVGFLDALESWSIPVFGSLVAAELLSRVIASRSENVARRSAIGAGLLYISVGMIPVFLGVVMAGRVLSLPDAEVLLPTLALELLPTFGYVIFSAGLISAILSTVDSTLLVSSGLFSHNLVVPLMHITSERSKVMLARLSVVGFGAICFVLAVTAEGVFALVEQASALGSAGLLVTVLFGLFTNFGGRRAAIVSLLGGVLVYVSAGFVDAPYPFLGSLGAALLGYVATAALTDDRRMTGGSARPDAIPR